MLYYRAASGVDVLLKKTGLLLYLCEGLPTIFNIPQPLNMFMYLLEINPIFLSPEKLPFFKFAVLNTEE